MAIATTGQAFKRMSPCFNSCTATNLRWPARPGHGDCVKATIRARMRETMSLMPANGHNPLGLYISIPFCRSKCTYCNFASGVYPASGHERYVDRLIEELRAAPSRADSMQAV